MPKALSLPYTIQSPRQRCRVIGSSITSGELGWRNTEGLLFDDVLMLWSGFRRDLLKWLCSAIMKSTESKEPAGERDEHLRLV